MASARNKVIEGDYKGKGLSVTLTGHLKVAGIKLGRDTIEEYEVMDSDVTTSGVSAVGRAAVGAFFLGPVGLLAGASAKKKGVHLVAVQFKDGKRSLMEIDENVYKILLKDCFK